MQQLAPRPGIKPVPPALGAQDHWTTKEVPSFFFLERLLITL